MPVGGYPRYENPYVKGTRNGSVGFPVEETLIRAGDYRLSLDWPTAGREEAMES